MSLRNKTTIIIITILAVAVVYMFRKMGAADEKIAQDKADLTTQVQLQNKDFENLRAPLDRAVERMTKKPFGIHVTPQDSPVQPERFSGFHTGADLEIFSDELNKDMSVKALCTGQLRQKQTASGYGGVIVTDCTIQNQPVTVVYGHLALSTIKAGVGSTITAGDVIGTLGADKSKDTGGERKHLHLGIHKGKQIDIRGYVRTEKELDGWIDPKSIFANLSDKY